MNRWTLALLGCAAALSYFAVNRSASAQGTASDYDRANALQASTAQKVFRQRIRPVWSEGGTQFHYRVSTASNQHRFYWVDAEAGIRREAFDHERLAKALTETIGQQVSAEQLPLRSIRFDDDGDSVRFRVNGSRFRCDLSDYALTTDTAAGAATQQRTNVDRLRRSQRSRTRGGDVQITFVNQLEQSVTLEWVDPSGNPQAYGEIEPGEQRDQHSFVGHVWKATSDDGQHVEYFRANEGGDLAVIGEPNSDATPRPRDTNRSDDNRERESRSTRPVSIQDHNLWVERDGSRRALTDDGNEQAGYARRILWSPDESAFIAMFRTQGEQRVVHYIESSPDNQLQPVLHEQQYDKPGDRLTVEVPHLYRKEADDWKRIPIDDDEFSKPWSIQDLRWASDGSRFFFVFNQRGHQSLRYLSVDAETGDVTVLINEQSETFVDYAHKAYRRYLPDTDEMIWMSERDGWCHLYLYDATTGELKDQITQGAWVVREVVDVDIEQRQLTLKVSGIYDKQDPYHIHFVRVGFDGRDLIKLTAGDGTHEIEQNDDGRYYLDRYSRVDLPPITELRDSKSGRLICELERASIDQLVATGWRAPVRFSSPGRDGKTNVYGIIYFPQGHDPERSYPVIEKIYAGPQGSFVPKRFASYRNEMAIAELGFIVVQVDGMGTSNRSKAFHDVCWKNLGDSGFPDHLIWIRAAAERYPSMDLDRVGLYGGSAGGQSTVRGLLMYPDFYKVGVADCGCHDNRMDKVWWNELWMGWPLGAHYEEQSNVTQAHRLQGQLMLTVGELDRNVDPASTMQVVNALIKADKDFDLIVFPGRGHGIGESAYGRRRRRDFFVRHLLGVKPRRETPADSY